MLRKAQEGRKTFQWNVFRREPSQGVPCGTNVANKRELSGGQSPPLEKKEMLRASPLKPTKGSAFGNRKLLKKLEQNF